MVRRISPPIIPLFLCCLLLAAGAPSGEEERIKRSFTTMHTVACLTIPLAAAPETPPSTLADAAEAAIRRANTLFSPRGADSDVVGLNESGPGQWVRVDAKTMDVVAMAAEWHRLTGGAFDPTIGPLKRLFDFNGGESERWPSPADLAEAKARVGMDRLLPDEANQSLAWSEPGMRLDLGAIAKGYAIDQAVAALAGMEATSALVDIGGEVRALGRNADSGAPWRVGITDPRGGGIVLIVELEDQALATSGNYESFFLRDGTRYAHIIDPRSGLPIAGGVASATVLHPNSATHADALATALCVLGTREGKTFFEHNADHPFLRGVTAWLFTVADDGSLTLDTFTVDDAGGGVGHVRE